MKIGELGRKAGVGIDTIRYYERRGLLTGVRRTASGYRDFDDQALRRLRFIVQAKALGFTLEEIRELLSLRAGKADCEQVRRLAERKAEDIGARIAQLTRMQQVLRELAGQCARQGHGGDCPILHALEENT